MIFKFEGYKISGQPINSNGEPLNRGDEWFGPHQGIPYILTAGGNDIKYEVEIRQNVRRKVSLSETINREDAQITINMIRDIIGPQGGRFYVNEFGAIFTPRFDGNYIKYIYIGNLKLDFWFPKPQFHDINGEIIIF